MYEICVNFDMCDYIAFHIPCVLTHLDSPKNLSEGRKVYLSLVHTLVCCSAGYYRFLEKKNFLTHVLEDYYTFSIKFLETSGKPKH